MCKPFRAGCLLLFLRWPIMQSTATASGKQKGGSMPTPVASAHQRLTFILAVASCIVLLPLTQASLGYLSARVPSPWYWLIGTPLCYLLISALAAFCASGS